MLKQLDIKFIFVNILIFIFYYQSINQKIKTISQWIIMQ
jgi:hypothetical protein